MSTSTSDEREGDGVRGSGVGVEGLSNECAEECLVGCGCNIFLGGCMCNISKSSGVSLKLRLCWQWGGGGAGGANEGMRVSGSIEENG